MIGETVSHYKILSRLGEGGMGVVYEAEDSKLGRRVALKFLSEDTAKDDSALHRFQREARAASALNHPGICTIHSIEQHESQHFIVMEMLEGETLAARIRCGPIDITEAIGMSIEIADALESAHSKGIVHRDLKPANIFINERGQVKVLDFGLAKMDIKDGATNSVSGSGTITAVRREELTKAGSTIGTVAYMSPEQARGQIVDSRTDIFSLGTVIYQMVTGEFPFKGETSAVIFDSILNREPTPIGDLNPSIPDALGRIIARALEKDRTLRYQNATDIKTELRRLRRDVDSGNQAAMRGSSGAHEPAAERDRSIAVLYFENLSGVKEDEYFRDGITEDIITELSKIKGLNVFARAMILTYKDKQVTPAQIAQQLDAGYVLMGSIRRAGNRLRINTQLVDTRTGFPLWSERYDREMKDIFEVQDEIARKIADALRITLSPQEQEALAARPTENLEAYDLYLRGRNYARKLSRQDLEFALQMFEKAASLDPGFTLAHAAVANVCAQYYYHFDRSKRWLDRAEESTTRGSELGDNTPEVQVAQSWLYYAGGRYEDAIRHVRRAIEKKPDTEGAYYLLGRALFASGRYQELIEIADEAIAHSGEDYNTYMPISNALGALGKSEESRSHWERGIQIFEAHLKKVPEDARARTLLATNYASLNRSDDASRELNLAIALRPGDPWVLYNIACTYCRMGNQEESLRVLKKAWDAGFRDPNWARRDPDLEALHDTDGFQKLFPAEDAN